jgi:hypothetical protein
MHDEIFLVSVLLLSGASVRSGSVSIERLGDGAFVVVDEDGFEDTAPQLEQWRRHDRIGYVDVSGPDFSAFGAAKAFVETLGLDRVREMLGERTAA